MKIFSRDLKPYTGNCNIARRARYEWRKRVISGQVRSENVPGASYDLDEAEGEGVFCIGMIGFWLVAMGVFFDTYLIMVVPGVVIAIWAAYRLRTMK